VLRQITEEEARGAVETAWDIIAMLKESFAKLLDD
jgi:hypothetical protein